MSPEVTLHPNTGTSIYIKSEKSTWVIVGASYHLCLMRWEIGYFSIE